MQREYRITLHKPAHTFELVADSYYETYENFRFYQGAETIMKIGSMAVSKLEERIIQPWEVLVLTGGKEPWLAPDSYVESGDAGPESGGQKEEGQ